MKKKIVVFSITMFAVLLCCSIMTMQAKTVRAEGTALTFSMSAGASARIDKECNGLRFAYSFTPDEYDFIKARVASLNNDGKTYDYDTVEFGMLIAPVDYLVEGRELTEANVFGENAIYDWAVLNKDTNEWVYSGGNGVDGSKTRIINLTAEKLNLVDGKYTYYGSIINILDKNIAREFKGVGYVKLVKADVPTYYFATENDNNRSIAYVAQRAIEDENVSADVKTILRTKYLDKVANVKSDYTVEHYFENEQGEYVLDPSKTQTMKDEFIGTTVNAVALTVADYTPNTTHADSVTSGVVYANNRLVLKVYYDNLNNDRNALLTAHIADNTYNWAGKDNISFYSSTCDAKIEGNDGGIKINMTSTTSEKSSLVVNSTLFAEAVEQGYTYVYFKLSSFGLANTDHWPVAKSNGTVLTSENVSTTYGCILLSTLQSGETYNLEFSNYNAYSSSYMILNELKFTMGAVVESENYAKRNYRAFWSSNQTIGFGATEITSTHVDANNILTISGKLLEAAVSNGYNTFTVTAKATYSGWLNCYNSTTRNDTTKVNPISQEYWASDMTGKTAKATLRIADFYIDGTYADVQIASKGGWEDVKLTISGLTFDKELTLDEIKESISETTNYAGSEYVQLFTGSNVNYCVDATHTGIRAVMSSYTDFNEDIIAYAVSQGYTTMTVEVNCSQSSSEADWVFIKGGARAADTGVPSNTILTFNDKPETQSVTINIADKLSYTESETTRYALRFSSAGHSKSYVSIASVTFSK